jgi:2-succinyl-5-enolpyruvyl-6-hydroxy-3-cyclohexene-1-carboxylate synthase
MGTPPSPPGDPPAAELGTADLNSTFCAALVDQWSRLGLSHAFVSPGSRSTPLALALVTDPRWHVEVVIDERSASFAAVGCGALTGVPAVLLCTSGTAAAEFHAAVVEAHQSAVPLLVVTADRPPELQGVWAPQTIDQRRLYGSAVRWYCEPGPPMEAGRSSWRALATDAYLRTLGVTPGPVHLDLAFREPLAGEAGDLPPVDPSLSAPPPETRRGAQWGLTDEERARLVPALAGRRGVVVAGVRAAVEPGDSDAIIELAHLLGWPLLADAQSGCRLPDPAVVTTSDAALRSVDVAERLRPEFVLRIGGLLASKVLAGWLRSSGALQIGLDRSDRIPDPDRQLTRSIVADPATVAAQIAALAPAPAPIDWTRDWAAVEVISRAAIDATLDRHGEVTEPAVAGDVLSALPDGAALVVASSMPVRDLEWYAAARGGVTVWSNRGANGIDGVVSTAIGVAATGRTTVALVGDLAFLHDASALTALRSRHLDLVIVVVDNNGGGIFSFLPQRSVVESATFERVFATPHGVDLAALAGAHGIDALVAETRAGVRSGVSGALARRGTRVVVARSERDHNVSVHDEINAAVAAALGSGGLGDAGGG